MSRNIQKKQRGQTALAALMAAVLAGFCLVMGMGSAVAAPGHHPDNSHGKSNNHAKSHHTSKSKSAQHHHSGQGGKAHSGNTRAHGHGTNSQASHASHSRSGDTASHPSKTHGHKGSKTVKDPAGNNGTVKIDRVAFDDHPNNQPHVGCVFQVDFYGYDQGSYNASVLFEDHPPTLDGGLAVSSGQGNPSAVFIGEDSSSGGGSEAGLDASETYTLVFSGTPHPMQGFHVKLTINAPGSQGSDVKHKVFWVQDCGQSAPPPTDSGPGPHGTIEVECTGRVTVVMDNTEGKTTQSFYLTRTTIGTAPQGTAVAIGGAAEGRRFDIAPGETRTIYRHGSPGEMFELAYAGGKDRATVPARCSHTPPPLVPPEPPTNPLSPEGPPNTPGIVTPPGVPTAVTSGLTGPGMVLSTQTGLSDSQSFGLVIGLIVLGAGLLLYGMRLRRDRHER